jgi:hypothetical protein
MVAVAAPTSSRGFWYRAPLWGPAGAVEEGWTSFLTAALLACTERSAPSIIVSNDVASALCP